VKGSPAGGILLMSTVASFSGCGPRLREIRPSAGASYVVNSYIVAQVY
jgi:hypothetical protein